MQGALKAGPGAIRAQCPRPAARQPARRPAHARADLRPHPHRRASLAPPAGILDSYRAATASSEPEDEGDGDDADVCPVDCVAEISTPEDLDAALASAGPNSLVVVDFYKTSCGACRYIAPGFVKLCKSAGKTGGAPDVLFYKHNVLDDDGKTDLAVREAVKSVPTFYFYRAGERLEAFPTRDRAVIAAAVNRLVGREVL